MARTTFSIAGRAIPRHGIREFRKQSGAPSHARKARRRGDVAESLKQKDPRLFSETIRLLSRRVAAKRHPSCPRAFSMSFHFGVGYRIPIATIAGQFGAKVGFIPRSVVI